MLATHSAEMLALSQEFRLGFSERLRSPKHVKVTFIVARF